MGLDMDGVQWVQLSRLQDSVFIFGVLYLQKMLNISQSGSGLIIFLPIFFNLFGL